jgi:hypothetical protein
MEKTTFKTFLAEVPLGAYQTIGDFSKPHAFQGKTDPALVSSPKAIENVRKKFGKTPYVINMFFDNKPGARRFTEHGKADLPWVEQNLGADVAKAVEPYINKENNITIIYVSNVAAQKVPMTPWIMAHRMAHALARFDFSGGKSGRQFQYYGELVKETNFFLEDILQNVYNMRGYTSVHGTMSAYDTQRNEQIRNTQLRMIHLFQELCTFKSAREKNIRDYFEIYNELFAQYVIEGAVRFNKLPKTIGGTGWGKYPLYSDDDTREDYQDSVDTFANTLNYYFSQLMNEAGKGILVM